VNTSGGGFLFEWSRTVSSVPDCNRRYGHIRVTFLSHPIKGRIPEARNKPANALHIKVVPTGIHSLLIINKL